jgi:hypothetical protein
MKIYYKKVLLGLTFASGLMLAGCSDEEYADVNTNPDVLTEIAPENQFMSASLSLQSNDFEMFYDQYRRIMPWMQYLTAAGGNARNYTRNIDNFSWRDDRLYIGVGNALYDAEKIIEAMSADDQARYVDMLNIIRIEKAYYAFYVSDIFGSVAYTEAWQARYGGTLTPVYDDQRTLFLKLNDELKAAVTALNSEKTAAQVTLGNYDIYFQGTAKAWVRAANAVRLRLAMRLLKREAATAAAIIDDVLAQDAGDLMASNEQGWVFKGNGGFTGGGNWNPDLLYAGKPLVDFMLDNNDPRLDAIVAPNGYSQTVIDEFIGTGALEAGTTEDERYIGSFTVPDLAQANPEYYVRRIVPSSGRTVDSVSMIQRRLFQPTFDEGDGIGTGFVYMPVLTYAEFCFMRAELAARSITSEDAEEWYVKGVTASIEWYNTLAVDGKLSNYTALGPNEIADYLAQPGIAFDASIALNQIASQAYINYFKQPAEGWALWKRTGLPNTTTVFELPALLSNGAPLTVPRRAPLSLLLETNPNYDNQKAAYDAMLADPAFGADINDVTGRVWWDQ